MILAQLARLRTAAEAGDRSRMDLGLLLEIGTCPFPLMRVAGVPVGHLVHKVEGHGEMLSEENGVAEPITASMLHLLLTGWQDLDDWIDAAHAAGRRRCSCVSGSRFSRLEGLPATGLSSGPTDR